MRLVHMTDNFYHSPWDVWPYDPTIHLVIFVHRVSGLEPGVYFLFRTFDSETQQKIKESTDPTFLWESVHNPDEENQIPLYLLQYFYFTLLY